MGIGFEVLGSFFLLGVGFEELLIGLVFSVVAEEVVDSVHGEGAEDPLPSIARFYFSEGRWPEKDPMGKECCKGA